MIPSLQDQKIAIVHDWLIGLGGADRVLKSLHEIFPEAPIYSLFCNKDFANSFLPKADIRTSKLQKTYERWGRPRLLLPFLPSAAESFDLSNYDIVISSSVAYSKGLILKPKAMHISYCYSPTRQIWDHATENAKQHRWLGKLITMSSQHVLRLWDKPASTRVDHYVAISKHVQDRIKKYYRCDSRLIYPPVNVAMESNKPESNEKDYFLIVSRLHKHKNIDIAIKAFNKLGWPLIIIGQGPEYHRLKSIADRNVKLIGYQDDSTTAHYYRNCKAFIMPQEEDFGLTPLEAMSHGKPVIALRRGGALEYIQEGLNGIFFEDPTEGSLANAMRIFKKASYIFEPEMIKGSARGFSEDRFKREFKQFVVEKFYGRQTA